MKIRVQASEEFGYWYFTRHGVQPGSIPRGYNVLDIQDTPSGSYVKLDGVVNTEDLEWYDLKEEAPVKTSCNVKCSYSIQDLNELVSYYSAFPEADPADIWEGIVNDYEDEDLANDVLEALGASVDSRYFANMSNICASDVVDSAEDVVRSAARDYLQSHNIISTLKTWKSKNCLYLTVPGIGNSQELADLADYLYDCIEDPLAYVVEVGDDTLRICDYSDKPIKGAEDIEEDDDYDLEFKEQEYNSSGTSINSKKLPAVFSKVKFAPGSINLDYGGGKFDNANEYLQETYYATNLVYDPFNRTAEHNKDVLKQIRKNGGADTATCSNVLNVIKEEAVRKNVLENIKKLVKPTGTVYITVYEGDGKGNGTDTQKGQSYQMNRKTSGYLDEIKEVFPDAEMRNSKLIVAHPAVTASSNITAAYYDNDPERPLDPPVYDDPIEEDDIEEVIELVIDTDLEVIDDDGNWTYTDTSWAEGDGYRGSWIGWELEFITLGFPEDIIEHVDELIETKVPMDKGTYHISGEVKLVYDISDISYYIHDYDPETKDYNDPTVRFNYKASSADVVVE